MIEIMENIIGYTWGTTSYDDIIATGALILGLTCILLVINIMKGILKR